MWGGCFRLPVFFRISRIEQAKAPAPQPKRLDRILLIAAASLMLVEGRQTPIPTTPFESTTRPHREDFFGSPNQFAFDHNLRLDLTLFHGDAAFKPLDWQIHVTPIFNVNYVAVDELAGFRAAIREIHDRLEKARGQVRRLENAVVSLAQHGRVGAMDGHRRRRMLAELGCASAMIPVAMRMEEQGKIGEGDAVLSQSPGNSGGVLGPPAIDQNGAFPAYQENVANAQGDRNHHGEPILPWARPESSQRGRAAATMQNRN